MLNLTFRGHKVHFQYNPNVGEYSTGCVGNFIVCLGDTVRIGDILLIYCCGKFIKDNLIKDITGSNVFLNFCQRSIKRRENKFLMFQDFFDKVGYKGRNYSFFLNYKFGMHEITLAEFGFTESANLTLDINNSC